jgi:apolipoprotein N-acyltransferase
LRGRWGGEAFATLEIVTRIRRNAWLLAAASGVLQILIFPDASIYILSWVALAPLIYAILQCREQDALLTVVEDGKWYAPATAAQGFWLGYLNGILWYGGSCYWLFNVMHEHGNLGVTMSALILLLFSFYLGLYHGLFGLLLALVARRRNGYSLRALVFAPFAWVAVEMARAYITSFPWNLLGYSQIDNIPLTRIASFTGVYGLSFEIALVNTAVAAAFLVPRARRNVMLAAGLVAAVILQSGRFIKPPTVTGDRGATLVQANVPILESPWSLELLETTLLELRGLSVRPAMAKPGTTGLIVWPETPSPFFETDLHLRSTLAGIARATDSYVIASTIGIEHAGDPALQPDVYNSASLIAPNGAFVQRYDKIHLVPFGEYVPFAKALFFASALTHEIGTFARGSQRTPLDLGDYKVGAVICYESVFPNEVRHFALNGAEVLVNVSNDGWYGNTSAPRQHLNMARMRAVENDRWLLRDTNNGITAVIDPYGRIVAEAPRNQRTSLQGTYSPVESTTFYTRHGDWFPFLCAIITLAGVALRFREPAEMLQPAPLLEGS